MKRDLLAAFSAIDHETSAGLDDEGLDREFQRLLIRLCALSSLHGPDVPAELIRALQYGESVDPFALVSRTLDTGVPSRSECGTGGRELQQEIVHFSRIVDIGTAGFDLPLAPSVKRVRNSHRLPESLKVLSELMLVARGRLIQHGREVIPSTNRRSGSHRQEPWADVLVQAPTYTNDHVFMVISPRRRLRLQLAYYFDTLLCYLPPADAFTTLSAYLGELAPTADVQMCLISMGDAQYLRAQSWTYAARMAPGDPFAAVLTLLPAIRVYAPEGDGLPMAIDLPASFGGFRLEYRSGSIVIERGQSDSTRMHQVEVQLAAQPEMTQAGLARIVDEAVSLLERMVVGQTIRSIECGHIHLDRQLDRDQETGALIGDAVYRMLSVSQSEPPLLTPMMDDDHVLVELRPHQYARFLSDRLGAAPFTLIPESSPIIRAIAVALYNSLLASEQRYLLPARGGNLFLRLSDGKFCELFEAFDQDPVSGCVLFEAALLVYRTDPETFDSYVHRRFPVTEHVHVAAADILDADEPHDVKVDRIAELYRSFESVVDPRRPDPGFAQVVNQVLARASKRVCHLNILEDYYEVQQGKVRQLLQALGLPIQLMTIHFNTQTGRVAIDG